MDVEVLTTLEARRLRVSVVDRDGVPVLLLESDDVAVEISSEPGPPRTAAGGYQELADEAAALAAVLRARA